jgi:hypothetical protein
MACVNGTCTTCDTCASNGLVCGSYVNTCGQVLQCGTCAGKCCGTSCVCASCACL